MIDFLVLPVSIVIKAAIAVNATASTVSSAATAEPKSKRQVDQYLRTPGASVSSSLGIDGEQDPQAYPLQLSHNIYNQQRLPLYTRRPTTIAKPQVSDDDLEQAQQPQQQVRSIIFRYFLNYSILFIRLANVPPKLCDWPVVNNWHFPVKIEVMRCMLYVKISIVIK